VWDASGHLDSAHYHDPVAVAAAFNQPLSDTPADAATMTVDQYALRTARRFVTEHATRLGMAAGQIADLIAAVNELAANAVEHGGGVGQVSIWAEDGHVVCQLTDSGQFSDPLAGRIPVPPDAPTGGRGLLLVNQLCDLVRIHSAPGGTTIRIYLHR
jgi:anti-sigma regulatory factor (Ser/Thr protein kinase)